MEFASLYYFFLTIHNKVRNTSQLLCIRKCRRTPLELNAHLCSLKLAAELQFFFEAVSLTVWEVNKTFYNPSICKLLHLILTQAFKKSKLTSENIKKDLQSARNIEHALEKRGITLSFSTTYHSRATTSWSQVLLGFQKYSHFENREAPGNETVFNGGSRPSRSNAYRWKDCRDVERHFLLSS